MGITVVGELRAFPPGSHTPASPDSWAGPSLTCAFLGGGAGPKSPEATGQGGGAQKPKDFQVWGKMPFQVIPTQLILVTASLSPQCSQWTPFL